MSFIWLFLDYYGPILYIKQRNCPKLTIKRHLSNCVILRFLYTYVLRLLRRAKSHISHQSMSRSKFSTAHARARAQKSPGAHAHARAQIFSGSSARARAHAQKI